MSPPDKLSPVVRRLVTDAGTTTQSFGLGRVVGQIYAYLYFSREPRCLSDLERVLGISKGSASMGVRQLEQWDAVRKVWVKGDRKDYFQASDWFGKILKRALVDTVTRKMGTYSRMLQDIEERIPEEAEDPEEEFVRDRLEHLRTFHDRVVGFWDNPVVQRLLK